MIITDYLAMCPIFISSILWMLIQFTIILKITRAPLNGIVLNITASHEIQDCLFQVLIPVEVLYVIIVIIQSAILSSATL